MSIPSPPAEDLSLRAAAVLPSRVGRYQVVGLLGVGGTATVYLGRATGIGGFRRDVAIKVLHAHLRLDTDFVADFLREARVAAQLRHPNVLPVLDVGESKEGVYLVMDWVDGASLSQLMEQMCEDAVTMPVPIALRIVSDALSGLHAAHEMVDADGRHLGLVHRDVSPQNLLLAATGNVLLADFGIAKPTEQPGHTRTGIIKGKLPYMAPEQLRASLLDRRVDVWAAGIICWELLAGARVFGDKDQATLIQKVSAAQVPALRTLRPDLPSALLDAVDGAVAAAADQRWATAAVFRSHLVEAAKSCGGLAESTEVGHFLLRVLSDTIEARRDLARAAVVDPTLRVPAKLADPAPPVTASAHHGRGRSKWMLTLGAAMGVGALVFAFTMLRKPNPIKPPLPRPAATSVPAALPSQPLPSPEAFAPPIPPTISHSAPSPRAARPALAPAEKARRHNKPSTPTPLLPPLADNPYK